MHDKHLIKIKMEDALEALIDYRGKTPKKSSCGISTLSAKSVKNGFIDYSQCYFISRDEYKKFMVRGFPQKGDILLTTEAPLGVVAKLDRNDVAVAQRLLTLRGKKGLLDNDYLLYYLQSSAGQGALKARESGTTVTGIKQAEFRKIELVLPSIDTQKRIASILSSLDDKIKNSTQINHNLEEQAKAILDQNCLAHKTLKVGDIVSFANGFAFKSSTYIEKGKFKVVTIKNVQDGKIDTSSADCVHEIPAKMKAECILNIGDVLLSLTGNVGRTGIVCENNLLLNQRVAKIIPHQSVLNAVCYFIFRRPEMKAALETIARGTAQANLSPVETLDIEIPFDIPTLQDIALCMKSFFEQIISNEMEIQTLAQLRDTLLPKLMSGEIDVSEVEV